MKKRVLRTPTVQVTPANETIDVLAYARQVVAIALEVEGVTPPIAQPEAS